MKFPILFNLTTGDEVEKGIECKNNRKRPILASSWNFLCSLRGIVTFSIQFEYTSNKYPCGYTVEKEVT